MCAYFIFVLLKNGQKLQLIFFSLSFRLYKQFFSEGSANTKHITIQILNRSANTEYLIEFLKIESCSDSKVDEEGKEHSYGHHLLL